ncbi:hypothetical protein FXO38_03840 [Capsicum annuum]|nr:hypothetical protein FXO38_03840 [Capsicum annuum]
MSVGDLIIRLLIEEDNKVAERRSSGALQHTWWGLGSSTVYANLTSTTKFVVLKVVKISDFTSGFHMSKKMLTNSCNAFSIGLKVDVVTLSNKFFASVLSARGSDGSVVQNVDKHVSFPLELDLLLYTDNNQTNNISRVHEDLVLAEEAYIIFYAKRDTLWFSDFVALQMHNMDTIPKLSFSLPNHHASDVSESNAAAVDTSSSALRPTDAINS